MSLVMLSANPCTASIDSYGVDVKERCDQTQTKITQPILPPLPNYPDPASQPPSTQVSRDHTPPQLQARFSLLSFPSPLLRCQILSPPPSFLLYCAGPPQTRDNNRRRHLESPASRTMPPAYEIRSGGVGKSKKQSMAELKLRRLNELNLRLKEDLDRPRVKVAEASMS